MKKIVSGLFLGVLLALGCSKETETASESASVELSGWLTDLPAAQAQAKAANKLVLIEFTGSDWCPPCKALRKNVLASPEFTAYANDHLVLVELDFPRSKPQSDELKKTNEQLRQKFNVEGFPTIIILDADGKQLKNETGYGDQTVKEFVEELKKLKV